MRANPTVDPVVWRGIPRRSNPEHLSGAVKVRNIQSETHGLETVLSADVSIPGNGIHDFRLGYRIPLKFGRDLEASGMASVRLQGTTGQTEEALGLGNS